MYDALAISGGAARGAAFLGALQRLKETGQLKGVKTVSGTSIGALAATLVVQDADMIQAMKHIAKKPFELQLDLISIEPPFGVDSGRQLLLFMRSLIGKCTFQQLRAGTGKELVICATSLIQRKPVYFTADTHPNMEVAWAVRLSCSLPLLFGYGKANTEAFVDGGLTDNFPVEPLRKLGCKSILGLRFKMTDPHVLPVELTEYVMALMCCVAWQAQSQDHVCATVIELDVEQQAALDFSMCLEEMEQLFSVGYSSI